MRWPWAGVGLAGRGAGLACLGSVVACAYPQWRSNRPGEGKPWRWRRELQAQASSALLTLREVSLHFGARQQGCGRCIGSRWRCNPGERVALVGDQWRWQLFLLRVVHGLLQPTAGDVQRQAQVSQAMLFQRPYLMRLSSQANVALGLWLRGTPWHAAQGAPASPWRGVGLAAQAQRNCAQPVGRQQQRVAWLARAWALAAPHAATR